MLKSHQEREFPCLNETGLKINRASPATHMISRIIPTSLMSDPAGAITRWKTWTEPTWTATNLELNKSIFRLNNPTRPPANPLICGPRWFGAQEKSVWEWWEDAAAETARWGQVRLTGRMRLERLSAPLLLKGKTAAGRTFPLTRNTIHLSDRSESYYDVFTEVKMQSSQMKLTFLKFEHFSTKCILLLTCCRFPSDFFKKTK